MMIIVKVIMMMIKVTRMRYRIVILADLSCAVPSTISWIGVTV